MRERDSHLVTAERIVDAACNAKPLKVAATIASMAIVPSEVGIVLGVMALASGRKMDGSNNVLDKSNRIKTVAKIVFEVGTNVLQKTL